MDQSLRKTDVLVLDWSVLSRRAWHRLLSLNYHIKKDELTDFIELASKEMLKIVAAHEPREIILAIDPPGTTWRHDYVKNYYHTSDWYKPLKGSGDPASWYVSFDNKVYSITKNTLTDGYIFDKLSKKNAPNLGDGERYDYYQGGRTPSHILDAYPTIEKHITCFPTFGELSHVFSYYKGNRNSDWGFDTPKDEYKRASRNLALRQAKLYGARIAMAMNAEADDVIYEATRQHIEAGDRVTVFTSDVDLYQVFCIGGPGTVEIFDMYHYKYLRNIDPVKQWYSTMLKAIGGDSSDNIYGMCNKKKAPYPRVVWTKDGSAVDKGKGTETYLNSLILEYGVGNTSDINNQILRDCGQSGIKNLDLVWIERMPCTILERVQEALEESPVKNDGGLTLQHFFIKQTEVIAIVQTAHAYGMGDSADE